MKELKILIMGLPGSGKTISKSYENVKGKMVKC